MFKGTLDTSVCHLNAIRLAENLLDFQHGHVRMEGCLLFWQFTAAKE
jgi:hypothetical protein